MEIHCSDIRTLHERSRFVSALLQNRLFSFAVYRPPAMSYQENFAKNIKKAMEALEKMPPSGESVVVVTDFTAAHTRSYIDHIKNEGHTLIMLPGAFTPVLQVNDTNLHSHFEILWETEKQQRDLRPAELDWLRFARKLSQFKQ